VLETAFGLGHTLQSQNRAKETGLALKKKERKKKAERRMRKMSGFRGKKGQD